MTRFRYAARSLLLFTFVLFAAPLHAQSFRTELIDNGNGFTANETFATSTTAATGYDAYATWDASTLFFGVTGQDVGDPACDPAETPDCPVYEQGQAIDKYLVYYLDTDPLDDANGTTQAKAYGSQTWTLPFNADYLVEIETSGTTSQTGTYTGQSFLYEWDGAAWTRIEPASGPNGSSPLVIGDNNTSNYLEFSLDRAAVGSPDFLRTAAWFTSTATDQEVSYAYWPASAPAAFADADAGTTTGSTTIDDFYGFVLIGEQFPAASAGQANLNRPFFAGLVPTPVNNNTPAAGSSAGSLPFHSIGYSNSNDFSGANEFFVTSTDADTGYDAYVTWDDQNLYLGATGSDIGGGDCSDLAVETCDVFELGQSPNKWLVHYIDSDPDGPNGTDQAEAFGAQSWTLPFLADYQVLVRTDGFTSGTGAFTGVATVKQWDGSAWTSVGPVDNLEIFDNSSSGFLKLALDLDAIGSPGSIKIARWFFNTEDFASTDASDEISYAYWPAQAPTDASANGTTSGAATLDSYYGFILDDAQLPNGSGGLANLDRPFFGTFACPAFPTDPGDSPGTSRPFHSIPINGSNSFNTANEQFATSTTASTGYAAYATWDRQRLYFGFTGSDVGGGDCADTSEPGCEVYELGQSPEKWIVYYLDTDPTGSNGTTEAYLPPDTIATDAELDAPLRGRLRRLPPHRRHLGRHHALHRRRRGEGVHAAARGRASARAPSRSSTTTRAATSSSPSTSPTSARRPASRPSRGPSTPRATPATPTGPRTAPTRSRTPSRARRRARRRSRPTGASRSKRACSRTRSATRTARSSSCPRTNRPSTRTPSTARSTRTSSSRSNSSAARARARRAST